MSRWQEGQDYVFQGVDAEFGSIRPGIHPTGGIAGLFMMLTYSVSLRFFIDPRLALGPSPCL